MCSRTPSEVEMQHAPDDQQVVAEQLREELLARTWAVHAFLSTRDIDVGDPVIVESVDTASALWARMLFDQVPESRRRAASSLRRILWPAFGIPRDEWWSTPVGEAIRGAATSRRGSCREEAPVTGGPPAA
jgi:hypothetical protein